MTAVVRLAWRSSSYTGGGIFALQSSVLAEECLFLANAAGCGAAVANLDSQLTATNCAFIGNSAPYRGAGMFNQSASPTVRPFTRITAW